MRSVQRTFMAIVVVTTAWTGAGCSSTTAQSGSAGPRSSASRPLEKGTAAKLITSMGYTNVVVGAVVQGIGFSGNAFSSESIALVLAVGTRNGMTQKINQSFFYDLELGWFYSEFADNPQNPGGTSLRIWTASGYKEVRPSAESK